MGKSKQCAGCGKPITFLQSKGNFRRGMERGMLPQEYKEQVGYRCSKCATAFFKEHGILTPRQRGMRDDLPEIPMTATEKELREQEKPNRELAEELAKEFLESLRELAERTNRRNQ